MMCKISSLFILLETDFEDLHKKAQMLVALIHKKYPGFRFAAVVKTGNFMKIPV